MHLFQNNWFCLGCCCHCFLFLEFFLCFCFFFNFFYFCFLFFILFCYIPAKETMMEALSFWLMLLNISFTVVTHYSFVWNDSVCCFEAVAFTVVVVVVVFLGVFSWFLLLFFFLFIFFLIFVLFCYIPAKETVMKALSFWLMLINISFTIVTHCNFLWNNNVW